MNYRTETWVDPRLELRSSPIHGRGLFATAPIAAGETVLEWGGTLYTRQQLADIRAGRLKVPTFSYSFIAEDVLIAAPEDGLDYFVNHSCDPSVWMAGDVTVVALRDIATGDEITGDYAVWEATPDYRMACLCGAAGCRGEVTGNDWQRPELQARYRGHFLPYISARIAALGGEA
jgi:hypothetical protein